MLSIVIAGDYYNISVIINVQAQLDPTIWVVKEVRHIIRESG